MPLVRALRHPHTFGVGTRPGPGGAPRLFGDVVIVAFLLAQLADGVFTYFGVLLCGHGIEGNPLLAWLMRTVGVGTTLWVAKGVAAGLGAVLHLAAVHRVVAALTVLYVVAAILPWAQILISVGLL